ncbi:MAG: acetate--CoA ligase family protein [Actinomycetota bacterium]|nr:acetate--CoA ligase family protein [Actinomycetota bacterium]
MDSRANLARLLSPATLAVVGANEKLGMSNNSVIPMLEAGREIALINPNRNELYGQPALASLTAVGRPMDAVLSLVNAERSLDVMEEAAALGCGGVVITAAGFLEAGESGVALQDKMLEIAQRTGLAVIGPNCAGFKNVNLGVNLFTGGRLDLVPGGVAIVSQSGFLVRSAMAAADERGLGVSVAISSGNEAVCDLADHVAVLAADPLTTVICLVIETVRRPAAFFAAVAEAHAMGKPVIALKLGRSDRARRIMQSHTGAIADASWVYDLAFREHGVIAARDIDDLLDRAQLLAQIPADRRRRIQRIGMITTSGGVAALATDIADEVGAPLPPLAELEAWVRERVPGDTVNPLDLTGFVMSKTELMEEVFEKYASAVDALVLAWWTGDGDEGWSKTLLGPFANAARRAGVPFIVSPLEATGVGGWVHEWREQGLLFARGVESIYRAVDAFDRFVGQPVRGILPAAEVGGVPLPHLVSTDAGRIASFADAMHALVAAGIKVAPYAVLHEHEEADGATLEALGDRLVVKLADVPHRTELGAVRLNVHPDDVHAVVAELRVIAAGEGVPGTVAIQAMVQGHGEAFGGLNCGTDLGAVVLLGVGGVLIEVMQQVGGRFLPLDDAAVVSLAEEVAGPVAALRGQRAWSQSAVEDLLRGLDSLWRTHGGWLDSVDINPLIVTDDGLLAVDALMVARRD